MLTLKLWAVSPDTLKYVMKLSPDEENYEERLQVTTVASSLDMTPNGWIEIGTVDMDFHPDFSSAMQSAVKTCDVMEAKLREKFAADLLIIQTTKQEFLALPNLSEEV